MFERCARVFVRFFEIYGACILGGTPGNLANSAPQDCPPSPSPPATSNKAPDRNQTTCGDTSTAPRPHQWSLASERRCLRCGVLPVARAAGHGGAAGVLGAAPACGGGGAVGVVAYVSRGGSWVSAAAPECWRVGSRAVRAEGVCRVVFPGVRTGLGFHEDVCVACPPPLGNMLFAGGAVLPRCCLCPSASHPRRRRRCLTLSHPQDREVCRGYVHPRHATSVWQGNWFSVAIGPVLEATQ